MCFVRVTYWLLCVFCDFRLQRRKVRSKDDLTLTRMTHWQLSVLVLKYGCFGSCEYNDRLCDVSNSVGMQRILAEEQKG